MYDRETENVWIQVSGRAVKGTQVGTRLKSGPLLDTTWGRWKALHPDTLVMSPDTPYREHYPPKGQKPPRGFDKFPALPFLTTLTRSDKRLPQFDMVLAVALPPATADPKPDAKPAETLYRAYPLKTLQESPGLLSDTLGTQSLVVFFEADTQTANAFSRILDGKTLTFEARKLPDGKTGFYDKETGTRWTIEGKGEEGPMAGKTLTRLDNHLSEWYGWVSYFPQTSIYGRDDPPQTVDLMPAPSKSPDK